jgi:uroporphyrinogen decarboxylase
MNSRERVLRTLRGEVPDRVPLFELFIDPGVIEQIKPGMNYADFVEWADLDVVTCLTMSESPEAMHWIDRAARIWRDKWGCTQGYTGEVMSVPIDPPRVRSLEDLANYVPPDPAHNEVRETARGLVRRFHGRRAVCAVGEAVFAVSQYLRAGLANLMIDYIAQPELARKLARIGAEYHVELYRRLMDEGVEIIALGDDYAGKTGTYMSPAHFDEFVLPGLKTVVQEIKAKGGYCIKHTDGNIWGIMDSLLSTGLDMLGPLEPAYMALDEVRRYSGSRVGVVGNVDVDLLSRGECDEVVEATKEQLRRVSTLGGHFLGSGNSISSSVRGDNYLAMVQTVQRFGRYPIEVA